MRGSIRVDTSQLERKLAALVTELENEARPVLLAAARGTLRRADPGEAPYQRAQKALWADLHRIFYPVDRPTKADGRIASTYRSLRGSRPARRIAVSRRALAAHHARISARFGKANAGFNPGARISGFRPPGWVARHRPGQGSATWRHTGAALRLRIVNEVSYAARVGSIKGKLSAAAPMARAEMMRSWRGRHLPAAIRKAGWSA